MPFFSILLIFCGLFQIPSSLLHCFITNLKSGLFVAKMYSDYCNVHKLSEVSWLSAEVALEANELI